MPAMMTAVMVWLDPGHADQYQPGEHWGREGGALDSGHLTHCPWVEASDTQVWTGLLSLFFQQSKN